MDDRQKEVQVLASFLEKANKEDMESLIAVVKDDELREFIVNLIQYRAF